MGKFISLHRAKLFVRLALIDPELAMVFLQSHRHWAVEEAVGKTPACPRRWMERLWIAGHSC
jgi:hypothetical protein